jgi:hypothetical protein
LSFSFDFIGCICCETILGLEFAFNFDLDLDFFCSKLFLYGGLLKIKSAGYKGLRFLCDVILFDVSFKVFYFEPIKRYLLDPLLTDFFFL